ncbi:extensin family protein [Qingshengfaniella alkalisoli]|uniref:Extensin family protein n=1 Tax=Qingshengfaniella alkalisoli TaxID=2599296 RepID=A0A5B8J1R4_9RHOB|nr:extensin family protein [Qingshengfaniella alkalisoli]QDY68427.1 extensin family protein [Qingshengfaniella alkalisoli]
MKRAAAALACILSISAQTAAAVPPEISTRPDRRPAEFDQGQLELPRPSGALFISPRPTSRPENLKRAATVRAAGFVPAPLPTPTAPKRGALCGDPRLSGAPAAPIPAKMAGCGLDSGVQITAVDGIPLSQVAKIDCVTAVALANWVQGGLKPIVGRTGGGVAQIKVAAHYVCRPRNNQSGARVSEHGRGRAIDITGFMLRNGAQMNVLTGWNDRSQGKYLKQMHSSACGVFGTVLGPNANAAHRDHFHFDTARYRSGSYCR